MFQQWTATQKGEYHHVISEGGKLHPLIADVHAGTSFAALIAAAPELLAALIECVNQSADYERMTDDCAKAFRDARAAIAKAKARP